MSQIYVSAIVALLAQILPWFGVQVVNDELTVVVSNIITAGAAIWVMVRRYKQGDIGVLGGRKN